MAATHSIEKAIREKEEEREEIIREINEEISNLQGQLAVLEEITGVKKAEKDPDAVALGRRGGRRGGNARAKSMSSRERSESARHAANARWREKQKHTYLIDGAEISNQTYDPKIASDLLSLLEFGPVPRTLLTEALEIHTSKMSAILSILLKKKKIELVGPNLRRNTVYKLAETKEERELRLHVGHGEVKS